MQEEIKYDEWTLDPTKDVVVPIQIWSTLFRVIQAVERKLCKVETQDVFSWYHKETFKPLSKKSKISKEKLEKNYVKQIDIEKTKANVVLTRDSDGLSVAALELLGAFDHVFKKNIDEGNKIPKPGSAPAPVMPTMKVVRDESNETETENGD